MPSECLNVLVVTGPQEAVKAFEEKAAGPEEVFDIEQFIPMPEELKGIDDSTVKDPIVREELVRKYGASYWRDWAELNWGTKWSAYDIDRNWKSPCELEYTFSTAWCSFSKEAWMNISGECPEVELDIHYYGIDDEFKGRICVRSGELTTSWERELTEEEIREMYDDEEDEEEEEE